MCGIRSMHLAPFEKFGQARGSSMAVTQGLALEPNHAARLAGRGPFLMNGRFRSGIWYKIIRLLFLPGGHEL